MRRVDRCSIFCLAALLAVVASPAPAQETSDAAIDARFQKEVKPLLVRYCYDCHADDADEGGRAFDDLEAEGTLFDNVELWSAALANLRAGIMPPPGSRRPPPEDLKLLVDWVKQDVFKIDYAHPDPGRTVMRRLNRREYQNTIRDLLGYDYDVLLHFPPDDTGYGFDTIGEVLTVSTMLTEKYLGAAENIVDAVVPKNSRQPAQTILRGDDFVDALGAEQPAPQGRGQDNRPWPRTGRELHFDEEAQLNATFATPSAGQYSVDLEVRVDGQFEYNSLRSNVKFFLDDEQLFDETYAYTDGESFFFHYEKDWQPGDHNLRFDVTPLPALPDSPRSNDDQFIRLKIISAKIAGPTDPSQWVKPPNYDRIFTRETPPEDDAERLEYAREVLGDFATRAFRRPVDERALESLVQIAAGEFRQPEKTFEQGVARSMIAVLASPRFLYRSEGSLAKSEGDVFPRVDDYALASRLSYFFWSTMPDEELFRLAEQGQLRGQLDAQVARMLADERSSALVENFVGQWLRSRDVAHIRIDARAVVSADVPLPDPSEQAEENAGEAADEAAEGFPQVGRRGQRGRGQRGLGQRGRGRGRGFGRGRGGPNVNFDNDLRTAMQQETEMQFVHIMQNDRSLLELIDSDYAFLNQRLAEHYGIEGVEGREMRLVELPRDSPRGGVLTQGTLLTITSNPDRTSPVKRGLYILENILGTPPPPPPADIPNLEEAAEEFVDRTPTLREVLELHRDSLLCQSCHARMDPLGLALENFNALGMWRETDGRERIDPSGKLLSGQQFTNIIELKTILKAEKRRDFYRCVTEKFMIYALGRGMEATDTHTIDQIVDALDESGGKFSVLLNGVVQSPQFQRRREPNMEAVAATDAD